MAYLVTNPRRSHRRRSHRRLLHNGAVNMLIYKHLKLSGRVDSLENKAKIRAFKSTAGYAAWKSKNATGAAISSQKASMKTTRESIIGKKKTAAAKKAASKLIGKRRLVAVKAKANPRHYRRNFGGAFTGGMREVLSSDLTVGTVGGFALAGVAHFFLVPKVSDAIDMIGEKVTFIQPVTTAITTYVPYSTTGLVGGLVAGGVAAMLGRRQLGLSLGTALFGLGVGVDVFSAFQRRAEGATSEMGALAYGRTLRDAYGDVAYGGLVGEYGGTVVTDFGEASMADAAACGDDFSADEGQALLDGPAAMAALAGPLPVAGGARSGAYSRFAGRRMARWYWLVKCVGLQRAQQIAALAPAKRVKLLTDVRKQALASLDAALSNQAAAYGSLFESDKQQYGAFVYSGAGY